MTKYPALPVALLAAAAVTTGCSLGTQTASSGAVSPSALQLAGRIHGGQQPVSNAHVYLMAAGTTGYASAATSLLTTGDGADATGTYVLSDAQGNFSLTSHYACTPGQQVYALVLGGNPGLPDPAATNPALSLATVLGTCPSGGDFLSSMPQLYISEATTVAAAYALAPFASDLLHIGAPSTSAAAAGIANAFATAATLVSPVDGTVYATTPAVSGYDSTQGLSANGTVPQAELNTLANIAASCVNSDGTTGGCPTLFANAQNSTGVSPTETFTALLNIAHAPWENVSTLFGLNGPVAPFQPSLGSAPNDWTVAVSYTAPNVSNPGSIAVDAAGNVWMPNAGNNSLTQFDPVGTVLSGTTGFTGGGLNNPAALAVAPSTGNIFVANTADGAYSQFSSSGSVMGPIAPFSGVTSIRNVALSSSGTPFFTTDLGIFSVDAQGNAVATLAQAGDLRGITVDASGTPWAADFTSSVVDTLASGNPASYNGGGLSAPMGVALDATGYFWAADNLGNAISAFTPEEHPPAAPATPVAA